MHSLRPLTDTYQHYQRQHVSLDVRSGRYQQASLSPVFQNVRFYRV